MNINYKEFCESVFNTEVEKEKLNNVTLKILPISIINCSGYMIPNIKKSEYKIIINASNYSKLSLEDKKFYTYITICHEIEHIKAFERTKDENYYVFEHFMTLIEYISYLYDYNISYNEINLGIMTKKSILNELKRNYKTSTNELRSSLIGYMKANDAVRPESKKNTELIIKSLMFLNDNMQVAYNKNGIAVDKFAFYMSKTIKYINKYPKILQEYKILLNFFNVNGSLKEVYELYTHITEENKIFYNNFIINLLSIIIPNEKFTNSLCDKTFKSYLEELINAYNEKAIYYYKNINLGAIYINDKKILYENLKVILSKIKNLNELSEGCKFKRTTGMII